MGFFNKNKKNLRVILLKIKKLQNAKGSGAEYWSLFNI